MTIYPAYIYIDEDGSASGHFPDVKGLIFASDPDESLYDEAKSALESHFEFMVLNGVDIPEAHDVRYHVRNNADEYQDGGQWYNVGVDMTQFDGKVERINITLPHRLIYQIDTLVKSKPQYQSRSAFLADAARNALLKAG